MHRAVQARTLLLGAALLGAVSMQVHAVDGIVLIDQNKALAGGVTAGDSPGFPVTISRSGSYRLSSNLVVSDANTTAIVIAANTPAVTIDLNGFAITGPTTCSGFPLSCAPTGSGYGVQSDSAAVTVRNGTIIGMGAYGAWLIGAASTVEDMNIINNGAGGIAIELGTALRNKVYKNGGTGITGGNSVISYNNVTGNRFAGISVNDSLVTNNALIVNGGVGVAASNTGFATNVFSSNNGGFANPQFSGRTSIGANVCDGSVCP